MNSSSSKKVYTLTFHDVPNIGAALQAYALQRYVSSLGYDCRLADYRPFYHELQLLKPYKGLRRNIEKFKLLSSVRHFVTENIPLADRRIRRASQLESFTDAYAFIAGSDQIWNPAHTGGRPDDAYFLNFATQARKISYAASSGGIKASSMDPSVGQYISRLDSVSVREKFLENDLRAHNVSSNVTTVLDPTFLIDNYDEILAERPALPEKYIVSYEVSTSASREKFIEAVQLAKEQYRLPVVHLGVGPIPNCDIDLASPSPGTWLSAIRNSTISITNSFHGLLFSVNFDRPFVYVPHLEEFRNARPKNFLDILGLETIQEAQSSWAVNGEAPRWRKISPNLVKAIAASRIYLSSALKRGEP